MYSLLTVHRSTVILEIYYLIKLENSLLFEHRYIFEDLPPLPFLSIRYCPLFFYLLKTKASCVVVLF